MRRVRRVAGRGPQPPPRPAPGRLIAKIPPMKCPNCSHENAGDARFCENIGQPLELTYPGTGLGLHISYNIIVHKHQGQIRVFSRPGETRFQVSLPVRLRRAAS